MISTLGPVVAIDCETMGLNPHRDRLCVVQLSDGDGDAHMVQVAMGQSEAPNLCRLLADPAVLKLFHFGRFDIAALYNAFGALAAPVYCTKIASRLVRTYHRPARAQGADAGTARRRHLETAAIERLGRAET